MVRRIGKKNHVKIDPLAYNTILLGESGIGKEQPISEPVLTKDGWKPMGEIKVGEQVFGDDGRLHNVVGVYPQGVKDVYKVTFLDGTSTRCGKDHLWKVYTKKQRENMRKYGDERFKILTLKEIMKDYKTKSGYKYSVPINKPIQFNNNEKLPINPYSLGLLLGDGGFTGNTVTFTNAENDLFEELWQGLKSLDITLHFKEFENHRQATLVSSDPRHNLLRDKLRELRLLDCDSRGKFIPNKYIYTSVKNRLALLSGIINTDGSITHNNGIVITTYSKQMAEQICEVTRSLGFICTLKSYDRTNETSTNKYDEEIEYRLCLIGDYSQLSLSKKHKEKLTDTKTFDYVKSIVNIELVGQEESQCIMLDNPSHLYITKDYIVTHNTTLIKKVCDKLVGEDGYIFFEMDKESGADAIEGITYEDVYSWDEFEEFKDEIIENRSTDYKDLKVIVIDTYDGFIDLAEAESIRLSNKEKPDKKVSSINEAWGGYQRGQKKALQLMLDALWEFKMVGISFIIIGHVKKKEVTDAFSDLTYTTLTNDVEKVYFNGIKKKCHFVGLAYYDRQIIKEKSGKKDNKGKEILVGKVKDEVRKIKFRDDTYVADSKSRFADIVPEIDFDTDEFIKALTDAIKAEQSKSGKSFNETKKEQDKEKEERMKQIAEQEIKNKQQKEIKKMMQEVLNFVKDNRKDSDLLTPIAKCLKKHGVSNPEEITDIETAKELYGLIQ